MNTHEFKFLLFVERSSFPLSSVSALALSFNFLSNSHSISYFLQAVAGLPHSNIGQISSPFCSTPTRVQFCSGGCNLPPSCAGLCGFLQSKWYNTLTWNGCTSSGWLQESAAPVRRQQAQSLSEVPHRRILVGSGQFRHIQNSFCKSLNWIFDLWKEDNREKIMGETSFRRVMKADACSPYHQVFLGCYMYYKANLEHQ
jgi:hypothetical protein